jgi:hypothetical protein
VTLWVDKSFEDIQALIEHVAAHGFQETFEQIAAGLPTADLLAELDRVNKRLEQLNAKQAAFLNIQRQIVLDAILVGLSLAKAGVQP